MHSTNRRSLHERHARAEKATALASVLLAQFGTQGETLVRILRRDWGTAEWAALAAHCGVKAPSDKTIELVFDQLIRAAKRAA